MSYLSCNSCGVVVDPNTHTMESETIYNHDQDKTCTAYKCPVCKSFIPDEAWVDSVESFGRG